MVEGGSLMYARPTSDVSTGNWGATPLYHRIDEPAPDDGDYIESAEAPANDACEVVLGILTDPQSSSGHVIRYRYCKSAVGGNQVDLTVWLMQGATPIVSWSHQNIGSEVVPVSQVLSSTQADAITDYTDLRLRFEANTP